MANVIFAIMCYFAKRGYDLILIFRFFYLNIYAILLLIIAMIVFLLPRDIFFLIVQMSLSFYCAGMAFLLFYSFRKKLALIELIKKRNEKIFRAETFRYHSKTPCGRLMVNLALLDLQKNDESKNISEEEWKNRRESILRPMKKKNRR